MTGNSRATSALAGTAGTGISGGRTSASSFTSTPKNFDNFAALRLRVWNCGDVASTGAAAGSDDDRTMTVVG